MRSRPATSAWSGARDKRFSAIEQTSFLPPLAQRSLPFPRNAQKQVAEISPCALNLAMAEAADVPRRKLLGRSSLASTWACSGTTKGDSQRLHGALFMKLRCPQ